MQLPSWSFIPSWLYLMPGIYTLLVALLAGVVPTVEWYKHKTVKWTYGVALGLLCLLEVGSIRNDRQIQDGKHEEEMGKIFTKLDSMLDKEEQMKAAEERRESIDKDILSTVRGPMPSVELKLRALRVAKELTQFAFERVSGRPTGPRSEDLRQAYNTLSPAEVEKVWNQEDVLEREWDQQTEAKYRDNLASSVAAVVDELRHKGVFRGNSCNAPKNVELLLCATQIQNAAKRLP